MNKPISHVAFNFDAALGQGDQNHMVAAQLARAACSDVTSELSDLIVKTLDNSDWDALVALSIDPRDYSDPFVYLLDAQLLGFVKKYPLWPTSFKTSVVAAETFVKSELICRATNQRFSEGKHLLDPAVSSVLHIAKRKISELLNGEWHDDHEMEITNGSSLSVKKYTSPYHKMAGRLDVTRDCETAAVELITRYPCWEEAILSHPDYNCINDALNVVPGSCFSTVPKNAKTDRGIFVEPTINMILQRMQGRWLRQQLKRRKWVDLRKAQSTHRDLARQASVTDDLATIDLSMASDLISYMFVMDMLPFDYFRILDELRSKSHSIDGRAFPFEKFSSMGNGFTFELESMLFLALGKASCEYLKISNPTVSCYGDDIIIPSQAADLLIEVLAVCGLQTNVDKSYLSGPFRESCGGDYFLGTDVRPFNLKDPVSPRVLTLMLNQLSRKGLIHCFPKLRKLCHKTLKSVGMLNWGPDYGSDGHLVSIHFPKGRVFHTYENKPPRTKAMNQWFGPVYLLYRKFQASQLGSMNESEPMLRYMKSRYSKTKVYSHATQNLLRHYQEIGKLSYDPAYYDSITDKFEGFTPKDAARYVLKRRKHVFAVSLDDS